jgi:streptogramin lyase
LNSLVLSLDFLSGSRRRIRESTGLARCGAIVLSAAILTSGLLPMAATAAPLGVFTEFDVAEAPGAITAGPDGNLWFLEPEADAIGRITPTGVVTEFLLPNENSGLVDITAGPDGNLWFTEQDGNRIGRITPAGVITEFDVPTPNSQVWSITAGPDGNLWFTELVANRIGRITPAGVITEFDVPTPNAGVMGITAGPDGNVWFSAVFEPLVGVITPSGVITEYPAARAYGLVAAPGGSFWLNKRFSSGAGQSPLGEFVPGEGVTDHTVPGVSGEVGRGILGPDGNLWFGDSTDVGASVLIRVTPAGDSLTIEVPSGPIGAIAAGPDGNLWFTESAARKIATTGVVETPPDAPTAVTAALGSVVVSWSPPAFTGSGPITGYVITESPTGATYQADAPATTYTIECPGPGTYRYTVQAVNAFGTSAVSVLSDPVTVVDACGSAPVLQAAVRFAG